MTPAELFLEAAQRADDDIDDLGPYFYLALYTDDEALHRAVAPFVLTAFPDPDEIMLAGREERVLAFLFLAAQAEDIL